VTELFSDADDDALFERIDTNTQHVLQRYLGLPDRPDPHYSLRERSHKSQTTKSSELSERDVLIRMLYNFILFYLFSDCNIRIEYNIKMTQ